MATPVPLPKKVIMDAVTRANKVVVLEEGDPVLEYQLKALLYDEALGCRYSARWKTSLIGLVS